MWRGVMVLAVLALVLAVSAACLANMMMPVPVGVLP